MQFELKILLLVFRILSRDCSTTLIIIHLNIINWLLIVILFIFPTNKIFFVIRIKIFYFSFSSEHFWSSDPLRRRIYCSGISHSSNRNNLYYVHIFSWRRSDEANTSSSKWIENKCDNIFRAKIYSLVLYHKQKLIDYDKSNKCYVSNISSKNQHNWTSWTTYHLIYYYHPVRVYHYLRECFGTYNHLFCWCVTKKLSYFFI